MLELQFVPPSEILLKGLMRQLKELNLPSNLLAKNVSPHLTLLSSDIPLSDETMEKLNRLLGQQTPFSLQAVSLSTFANEQGVLYLGVVVTQVLLDFHQSLYSCVNQENYQLASYYWTERWVPHITLATGLSKVQVGEVVAKLELSLPLELRVSRLALVSYLAPLDLLRFWSFK